MRKKLGIIMIVVGLLVLLGFSIWLGFPATANFNRAPIGSFAYVFGIMCVVIGGLFVGGDYL